MERGVSRGKREVCPSDQATRKGLGNLLDSLACLGESRGDSPPASLADNDLPSLYGSPGAAWQDKPVGRCKMDQQNPSYISCTEDEQKDDVSIFFRDTLEKQIEAVVDTISPLYGDDFTQAHWKRCACVRITAILRTAKAFEVKKIDLFFVIIV